MAATASSLSLRTLDICYILSSNFSTTFPPATGPFVCARFTRVAHHIIGV